jgi:hypothetical protein
MEPPTSQAGKVATSAGIVLAGAALGALGGTLALPEGKKVGALSARLVGGVAGAIAGAGVTGAIALGLSEFVGGDWEEIERMAGLIGAGGVGLLAAVGLTKEILTVKDALAAPPGSPAALPATPASPILPPAAPQNYDAGVADSGRTLALHVGDTVTVTLPAQSSQWNWSASPGLVTLTSTTPQNSPSGGINEVAVFTATATGSGQIQGSIAGATFVLNINVL